MLRTNSSRLPKESSAKTTVKIPPIDGLLLAALLSVRSIPPPGPSHSCADALYSTQTGEKFLMILHGGKRKLTRGSPGADVDWEMLESEKLTPISK